MTLQNLLILSTLLFIIGLYGVLTRRSLIQMYMAIELMFNAVNINFLSFAYFNGSEINFKGHVFVLFIITVAAVEAAVGLALILAIYRRSNTIEADKLTNLKH